MEIEQLTQQLRQIVNLGESHGHESQVPLSSIQTNSNHNHGNYLREYNVILERFMNLISSQTCDNTQLEAVFKQIFDGLIKYNTVLPFFEDYYEGESFVHFIVEGDHTYILEWINMSGHPLSGQFYDEIQHHEEAILSDEENSSDLLLSYATTTNMINLLHLDTGMMNQLYKSLVHTNYDGDNLLALYLLRLRYICVDGRASVLSGAQQLTTVVNVSNLHDIIISILEFYNFYSIPIGTYDSPCIQLLHNLNLHPLSWSVMNQTAHTCSTHHSDIELVEDLISDVFERLLQSIDPDDTGSLQLNDNDEDDTTSSNNWTYSTSDDSNAYFEVLELAVKDIIRPEFAKRLTQQLLRYCPNNFRFKGYLVSRSNELTVEPNIELEAKNFFRQIISNYMN